MSNQQQIRITLKDNNQAAHLYGMNDVNLKFITKNLSARIIARGNELIISGTPEQVKIAEQFFTHLLELIDKGKTIDLTDINYAFTLIEQESKEKVNDYLSEILQVTARGKQIRPKNFRSI